MARLPQMDLRPRTSPEALLEDYGPYLRMTPAERQDEIRLVCLAAMRQWREKTPEQRERVEWFESLAPGDDILRRWAREIRERAAG